MIDEVELEDALIEGLTIDGAHHKQFYLESALKATVSNERFEELKKEYAWEDGTP